MHKSIMRCGKFRVPLDVVFGAHTQLLIQGQWWSMRSTQRRHTRQWCARGGLWRAHFWQKRASPLCTRARRLSTERELPVHLCCQMHPV